jgi:hypothetical protein
MSNSEAYDFAIRNAILPNVKGKGVLLADDHGSHFSEYAMRKQEEWKTVEGTLRAECLHHPLSKYVISRCAENVRPTSYSHPPPNPPQDFAGTGHRIPRRN